jgi:hypothetical protein
MKLIEGNLFITLEQAVEAGISSYAYLTKAKSTGAKTFSFLNDPEDRRKVLIQYEPLAPEHKAKIEAKFGNPYEALAKEPIKNMVTKDLKAEEYFLAFKYDGKKSLPLETVQKYTQAASWLNMLVKAEASKKEIKKLLNLKLADFWIKVTEIIREEAIDLPTSYKRLRERMDDYTSRGYESCISKHFGNARAKKVSTELAESLLLELISQPYHDDVIIARNYNKWAVTNDHEPITPSTVGNWRRANMSQVAAPKKGSKVWYNSHGKQVMRMRPSAPLLLIGSDDNDLDLYFQHEAHNKKGHVTVNYFHRFKLIVIMDAFNDYVLGYAQADTVTADLVRLAFLDAMHHIKELTGSWYLPHQLQTDNWGKGTLTPFYQSIATYTPATAKVARAKYIEQAFGTKWHQALRFYPNYAGNNITAKAKINEDHLALMKKEFPSKDMAPQQIEHFISQMRSIINEETGKTRQQEWLDAFMASPKSQERKISEMQMMTLFGIQHDYSNKISNRGLTPTLNGIERVFEIPEEFYLDTVGKTVNVFYDPLDFSRVLVTDGASLRFMAYEYEKLPSAIADFKPGDRARLQQKLNEKRRHVEYLASQKANRQSILAANKISAESLLQAGVQQKELMQDALNNYGQLTYGGEDTLNISGNPAGIDPLDLM